MSAADVVIVGGGLAGLACALALTEKRIPFLLVEASDGLGGRVRTDEHEGFLLDRGFQVYLTAYPEGLRVLNYDALQFRPFKPGAMVRVAGQFHRVADPWRMPGDALAAFLAPIGTLGDMFKMAALRRTLRAKPEDAILAAESFSTLSYLKTFGFTSKMIDRFFRPFFGGIMLDGMLTPSSRMFEFVFKMMAEGDTVVPRKGMGQIPAQLAAKLPPDSVRLNTRVQAIGENKVLLESGEVIDTDAIVLATEGPEAVRLAPEVPATRARVCACMYYAAPEPPLEGPWLVLNGNNQWPINNLAVMSEVSRDYAPDGKALVSCTVLGKPAQTDEELQLAASGQLQRWYGRHVKEWKHLKTYRILHGQPDVTPAPWADRPATLRPGVFLAGDYRMMPSINATLESGRVAAEAVAAKLG